MARLIVRLHELLADGADGQVDVSIAGLLANLAEDAAESDLDPTETDALERDLNKARQAIGQLKQAQDGAADETAGAMNRLKRLAERLGKLKTQVDGGVKGMEGAADSARRIVDLYNRLAPFCGLPPVPNPFARP